MATGQYFGFDTNTIGLRYVSRMIQNVWVNRNFQRRTRVIKQWLFRNLSFVSLDCRNLLKLQYICCQMGEQIPVTWVETQRESSRTLINDYIVLLLLLLLIMMLVVMYCTVRCCWSVDVSRCDSQWPRQCGFSVGSCQYRRSIRVAQRRTVWRSASYVFIFISQHPSLEDSVRNFVEYWIRREWFAI